MNLNLFFYYLKILLETLNLFSRLNYYFFIVYTSCIHRMYLCILSVCGGLCRLGSVKWLEKAIKMLLEITSTGDLFTCHTHSFHLPPTTFLSLYLQLSHLVRDSKKERGSAKRESRTLMEWNNL